MENGKGLIYIFRKHYKNVKFLLIIWKCQNKLVISWSEKKKSL